MEAADAKTKSIFPRREVTVETTFRNSKPISTQTTTYEYAANDKVRHIVETTSGNKTAVNEYIQIGNTYFCKEGSAWKKSKSNCEHQNMTMMADGDMEEFTVENKTVNGAPSHAFRWYKTWKFPKTSDGKEYFFEQIFSIDSSGVELSYQINEGETKSPESDRTETVITYVYGISPPVIKAPVD
jgi:hypothetical protein